jgi:RNA polymerase sigma-70 factor (ECF subfamily)
LDIERGIVQTLIKLADSNKTTATIQPLTQRRENPVQDEMELLARARRLEPAALTEIHERYYDPIFRYISFRTGSVMVAEDLASDVFLRLLSALRDKNAPQNTIRGWLYGVAARVVADYYRKMARTEETMLHEQVAAQKALPEELVAQQLSAESLHVAMQTLPESQQKVLALRFGAGMRIKEVAKLLDKSEGAVKQLQLRAVAALAQRLDVQGTHR